MTEETEQKKEYWPRVKTHGIHSLEDSGPKTLNPAEIENLRELRQLVKTEPGRQEIREEIVSRLVIMARKFFGDIATAAQSERDFWNAGVVARGGTYLAELRRWLDTFPPEKPKNASIIEMLRGDTGDIPDDNENIKGENNG